MLKSDIVRLGVLALLIGCALPGAVAAQGEVEPRTPVEGITIGGRVHAQFSTTSSDEAPSSDFRVRRARLNVAARVNEWIDGVAQVDFAAGNAEGRYLFIRGTLSPALRVSAGQFKRAFDHFELTSSSQILVIERAGRVRGVDTCSGVGGVCSYSRMSEQLEYSSLDVGVFADGVFSDGRAGYRVSFTNGTGPSRADENSAKSYSGRVYVAVADDVVLGANLATHDYPNPVRDMDARASAWALDAEWGNFEAGPHVQAGVMKGDNWNALLPSGAEASFLTMQTILAYRLPVQGSRRVRSIEPLVRVSWTDPNQEGPRDAGWLLTPGFAAHFDGRNKVAANVDMWVPDEGTSAWGLLLQAYLYF